MGFLKSGSYEFNDSYGDGKVVVTEAQVSALKNRIRNLGYSVPKHKLEYICDSNLEAYINNAAVVAGTATRSGSNYQCMVGGMWLFMKLAIMQEK